MAKFKIYWDSGHGIRTDIITCKTKEEAAQASYEAWLESALEDAIFGVDSDQQSLNAAIKPLKINKEEVDDFIIYWNCGEITHSFVIDCKTQENGEDLAFKAWLLDAKNSAVYGAKKLNDNFIIYWDSKWGLQSDVIDCKTQEEAEEAAYSTWLEIARTYAIYGAKRLGDIL